MVRDTDIDLILMSKTGSIMSVRDNDDNSVAD